MAGSDNLFSLTESWFVGSEEVEWILGHMIATYKFVKDGLQQAEDKYAARVSSTSMVKASEQITHWLN